MRPIDAARKAGKCGTKAYHNAYQKARYAILRKDPAYLVKERAYNKSRYAKPEIKSVLRLRGRKYNARPEVKARLRERDLLRNFGLTRNQYEELRCSQDERCAICKVYWRDLSRSLEVDHSHKTGAIRGLLCRKCNLVLGIFDDSIARLKAAIVYLETH